ncbi:MAG: methylmalonyl-CoA epimerase [Acidobacteriota bacterium]|nr:MAG: methylmalonyl-CoA epimerase [Acidobacteriota bacterium]
MIKRISHVGIATQSIAVMTEFYKLLGLEVEAVESKKADKIRVALMRVGESAIELMEATDSESPVARFLEKRGEGLHHISLEVDDLETVLNRLKERNIQLIDESPRPGADGRMIAFVHPRSTGGVLVELCQTMETF